MPPGKFSPKANEILRTIDGSTKLLYNTKLCEVCSLASHQQSQSTSAVSRGKGPLRHYLSGGGEQKSKNRHQVWQAASSEKRSRSMAPIALEGTEFHKGRANVAHRLSCAEERAVLCALGSSYGRDVDIISLSKRCDLILPWKENLP